MSVSWITGVLAKIFAKLMIKSIIKGIDEEHYVFIMQEILLNVGKVSADEIDDVLPQFCKELKGGDFLSSSGMSDIFAIDCIYNQVKIYDEYNLQVVIYMGDRVDPEMMTISQSLKWCMLPSHLRHSFLQTRDNRSIVELYRRKF